MLNGANSQMVSRITGKSPHEEASKWTRTFNVVASIRARRLQWVGHILRMKPDSKGNHRMVYKAMQFIYDNRQEGDLLMDVPATQEWGSLLNLAAERKRWRRMVYEVKGEVESVITSVTPPTIDKVERFKLTLPQRSAPKPTTTAEARAIAAYRARDEREMFFRPRLRPPERRQRTTPPQTNHHSHD